MVFTPRQVRSDGPVYTERGCRPRVSGVNPEELNGSKTAVFMATVSSDAEYVCINSDEKNHLKLLGISKCFHSNRISNFFNLRGPSTMIESAYGGGLQAVREAVSLIRKGHVTAALVGAAGIAFSPEVSYHLDAMSKLSHAPVTASFSSRGEFFGSSWDGGRSPAGKRVISPWISAEGFNRAESCVVLFLQRGIDAKRNHGSILGVECKNLGSRSTRFPEFCKQSLKDLLEETYASSGVDPRDVGYVEADGTAIQVGILRRRNKR